MGEEEVTEFRCVYPTEEKKPGIVLLERNLQVINDSVTLSHRAVVS